MEIEKTWNLLVAKLLGWTRDFILLLPNLAVAVLVLVGFWLAAKLARSLILRLLNRVSHSEQVTRLLAQTVFLALLAAGFFISLGIVGLQKTVASLLAGAGILGLALGFAFQDIAANFMAGIYLSIERPFRVGHLIQTKDFLGVVQKVHLRWTEMATPQGQLALIPNKQVFENPITNYTTSGKRRVDIKLGVSYNDDLAKVREVTLKTLEQISVRKPDTGVEMFFEKLGDSTIDLVARFWIDFTSKQAEYLAAQSEAIEKLKRAYDDNGITLPFPTQTLEFSAKNGSQPPGELAAATAGGRSQASGGSQG
jgi:small conductance mechanosensitive channel